MAFIIKVPKPNSICDPGRPLEKNQLIQAQVAHCKEAEKFLPDHLRTGIDLADIKTEGDAANYIRKVTKAIRETGGRAPEKVERAG